MKIKYSTNVKKRIPKLILLEIVQLTHITSPQKGIHIFEITTNSQQFLQIIHRKPDNFFQNKITHSKKYPTPLHECIIVYITQVSTFIMLHDEMPYIS